MRSEMKEGKLFIEGLEYIFPEKPSLKKIRNFKTPKKQQKWSRVTEYEDYDWSEGWEERIVLEENAKQLEYLRAELDRLANGEWLFINGELTYFNNYTYFFLQWFILEDTGEYPEFRDTSLHYYRFVEICDKAKLCTGHTLLKARRLGATSMIIARLLLKMLLSRNKSFGITSKTGDDAKVAFGFLVNAFQALPVFLKPQTEGNDDPKKVLAMKKQSSRIKKDQKVAGAREGLNNKADWRATGMNTYDSGAFEDILVDETGKYSKDIPVSKYLGVVTKCVKKGTLVTGKLALPTTVNPPALGGSEYKKIWEGSNQEDRSRLGETTTGLYRIFIPSYCGAAGYIGEFGESVWDTPTPEQTEFLKTTGCPDPYIGAKEYLQSVRDAKMAKDPADAEEEIRMNPFTPQEVFDSANDRCLFDLQALIEREKQLKEELLKLGLDPDKGELGRRGWFDKHPNGRVMFRDDPEGLWYVLQFLEPNESNRFEIKGGKQTPTNEELGAAGLDPIASGDATVDKGSDACCMIRSRYSSMNPDRTGIPMAMFLGRMKSPTKLNEQVFNGLTYYGIKVLAERAPISWLTYAEDNKLENYCYGTKRSDGTEVKGISASGGKAVQDEHAEAQVLASLHDHDKIGFMRLVRDRKAFSITDRTDYDAGMADGYANIAMKIPFKKPKKEVRVIKYVKRGRVLT